MKENIEIVRSSMRKREISIGVLLGAALSFVLMTSAIAGPPTPADMQGVADQRSEIERQMNSAGAVAASIAGRSVSGAMAPASTPEKEIERRRKLINDAYHDFMKVMADARAPIGSAISTGEGQKPPKGADAQAKSGDDAIAAAASVRAVPEPPRAVAVEGRVIIEGGQADARAPQDAGAGVRYTVEEKFVGNLIIADIEPEEKADIADAVARGKLSPDAIAAASSAGGGDIERATSDPSKKGDSALLRDYQIDTISTGVKVTSLGGGACVRSDGGRESECAEQDPFTKSKVSNDNKYGKLHDEVVMADRTGNKVRIEVAAPYVSFSTGSGKSKADLGCSSAVFEMGVKEFKQLVDNGSMTFSKQVGDADSASSSCRPGSTITLHMKVKDK